MRVLSVIGTRPEALKLGPVIQQLTRTTGMHSTVCVTGQHRDLLAEPLRLFDVSPDHDLRVRSRAGAPAVVVAETMKRLSSVVRACAPDWIMAVGDTSSVLGASLCAAHHRVRFAHVEAGLRTHAKWDPFPEEFSRRVVSVLADLHLAPTDHARRNLRREGVPPERIVVTGNPGLDALRIVETLPPVSLTPLWRRLGFTAPAGSAAPRLIVVTFHRRENIGRPMREICSALRDLARQHRGAIKILCLVHPNPQVSGPARRDLAAAPHIVLSRPLAYASMITVLKRAHLVLTDSGGLQEEVPWLRRPVLVLRRTTERPEGVKAGVAVLVGTDRENIVTVTNQLLRDAARHRRMSRGFTGYGDGHAAERIVRALLQK